MIEETMNFYQYNLGIYPEEGIKFALAYLLKILKILLKYSSHVYVEMHRFINKTRKRFEVEPEELAYFEDLEIKDIIREF